MTDHTEFIDVIVSALNVDTGKSLKIVWTHDADSRQVAIVGNDGLLEYRIRLNEDVLDTPVYAAYYGKYTVYKKIVVTGTDYQSCEEHYEGLTDAIASCYLAQESFLAQLLNVQNMLSQDATQDTQLTTNEVVSAGLLAETARSILGFHATDDKDVAWWQNTPHVELTSGRRTLVFPTIKGDENVGASFDIERLQEKSFFEHLRYKLELHSDHWLAVANRWKPLFPEQVLDWVPTILNENRCECCASTDCGYARVFRVAGSELSWAEVSTWRNMRCFPFPTTEAAMRYAQRQLGKPIPETGA